MRTDDELIDDIERLRTLHRPRATCTACKKPAPCPVFLEGRYEHGTMRGYNHGCACDDCRDAGSASRGRSPAASPVTLRDDGYVDWVAVERLLDGSLPWHRATLSERMEAGRRVITREGGPVFCERVLRLRHDAIRRLRDEVAA